jgi:cobalt/nickel transport system permease protein
MHQTLLDDYAQKSPLREKRSELKLFVAAFALLVGVFSTSPVAPLFIALTISLITVLLGKIPLRLYAGLMLAPISFAILGSVVIIFFGGGEAVYTFSFSGHLLVAGIDGINLAALVISRTLSGISCLFFLAFTTPMIDLFAVLHSAKLPDAFVELSMMVYRYIFLLLEEASMMRYAQITRLGYGGLTGSIRSLTMLGSTLFIRTWERGEKIYIAMDSRCYDGKLFILEENGKMGAADFAVITSYLVLVMALAYFTRDFRVF